jgi:hypothetical protein
MNSVAFRRLIVRTSIVLLIVLILGYGFFEAHRVLSGPSLTIETPIDGSAISSTAVTLTGSARNISFLTINDAPAFIDEEGNFSATLSPAPGYAIFTVSARDRFGRSASDAVHITVLNYCPIKDILYG